MRRAFTFVELAICVLILGILTAVTLPKFMNGLYYYRADGAAKRIAVSLHSLHGRAVS